MADGGEDAGARYGTRGSGSTTPGALRIRLRAVPAALSLVRERVRRWLGSAGWPDPELSDIVLAVHEAVTNSVEHGYADTEPGEVEVIGAITPDVAGLRRARLRVHDRGRWRPPPPNPGYRGRGLVVIHACMDEVEVRPGVQGTEIRMTSAAVPERSPRPAPMGVATVEVRSPATTTAAAEERHRRSEAERQ